MDVIFPRQKMLRTAELKETACLVIILIFKNDILNFAYWVTSKSPWHMTLLRLKPPVKQQCFILKLLLTYLAALAMHISSYNGCLSQSASAALSIIASGGEPRLPALVPLCGCCSRVTWGGGGFGHVFSWSSNEMLHKCRTQKPAKTLKYIFFKGTTRPKQNRIWTSLNESYSIS